MGKKGIVRTARHYLEYMLIVLFGALFMAMPVSWVYWAVRALGFCAFHVFRVRRDVTMSNLRRSLSDDRTERELQKIAQMSYVNIGVTFVEMLIIPKLARHVLDFVDMSDLNIVRDALGRGRGLILVSGHFGSWEMNGGALAAAGIPVIAVAKSQSNPLIDRLVGRYRRLFGLQIITTGAPLKRLIHALRNGEAIGLMSDQDAGKKGVFVDFFDRRASTPRGAAQLALKFNAPVVVTMTARTHPGRYKAIFKEVDVFPDDTVESLTQRYTHVMEEIIRHYPEQYFWMHRRWKTSQD